jgi:hypothetical protein
MCRTGSFRWGRPAGDVVRALAWLGLEKAESAVGALKRKLPQSVFSQLLLVFAKLHLVGEGGDPGRLWRKRF